MAYVLERLVMGGRIVRLHHQGCGIELAYQHDEPIDLVPERMVLALTGKDVMGELPDARLQQQNAENDNGYLAGELWHEEHRAQDDDDTKDWEASIETLPKDSEA
jgi:hypothetical protein